VFASARRLQIRLELSSNQDVAASGIDATLPRAIGYDSPDDPIDLQQQPGARERGGGV
jgi:hypothetical protein